MLKKLFIVFFLGFMGMGVGMTMLIIALKNGDLDYFNFIKHNANYDNTDIMDCY